MQKKIINTIIVIFIFTGLVYFIDLYLWNKSVESYAGDGEILPLKSGLLFKGYEISLPLFELDKPYNASYKLIGIPDLNKSLIVSLNIFIDDAEQFDEKLLNEASLKLELFKDNDEHIFNINEKIENWKRTSTGLDSIDFYFFNSQISSIVEYEVYKGNDLSINVKYQPPKHNDSFNGYFGKIIFRAGGHK